ncbi:TonB-dependent receptor [Parabacteroides goldsteinii]|uniref:TonB-dependent receptor n=1 Tax=Parabacteroides goldsteinii TaxID=328812 RepID=UPI0025854E42|nr:TonB-dependent receptor [Parabacteroides goldsteinii]
MKISVLLLFLGIFSVSAKSYGQETNVTFNLSNVTVNEVFDAIRAQTDYSFWYDLKDVDVNRVVSVEAENKSVKHVLESIFKDKNVDIQLVDNHIVLRAKSSQPGRPATAQAHRVTGVVKDHMGDPVIGANIVEKGTTNGTITNIDGRFSIEVSPGATLIISYIGYLSKEIQVNNQRNIQVNLVEDTQTLGEVVVVGFGSQKKENLTGAVSQVKMTEVLGSRPVTNAMSALQGTMPGLQITANNDAAGPGSSKNFNIRGTTSINGGGPLVLIDNVPGDIDMLNPEDIESVSVLKDAASSAIYGARAAFGVILVTTKKAQKGQRFQVNYNNNFGFQSSINEPGIANGMQWLQAYKDAQFGSGSYFAGQDIDTWIKYLGAYQQDPSQFKTYGDGIYTDPETGVNYYLNEKNVYTNMFDNFGFLQNHNASLSGGGEKITYRMSLGYNKEQGILKTDKDSYKRASASAYVSADITSWLTQSADVRYAQSTKNMPITSSSSTLYDMRKPSLYPEGYLILPDGEELLTDTPQNLLKLATDNRTIRDNTRLMSKTVVKPLSGLEMVFEYTFDKVVQNNRQNRAIMDYANIQMAKMQTAANSSLQEINEATDYHAINAYATYTRTFNEKHNLTAMVGFNQEHSKYTKLTAYAYDLINDQVPSFNTATGETKTITDQYREYSVRGAFYRLNYDYEGRYLFEANGRYDGSSKFPKKSRFGFFPSFSVGWNVAREAFMESTAGWLGELKLRGSWGQIGNQAIDPYQFTPVMSAYPANEVNWIVNGDKPVTIKAPGLVSDNFTWETVETLDFGVDIALLNNRLRGTFDWYQRDTKDMLAPGLELPALVGASAPLQNGADLRTKGWELSLNWRDKIGNWGYNVGFNLYDSRTTVTKYDNESFVLQNSNGENNYYTGYEIGTIWGYVTDGYYTVDDFEDTNTWKLKEGVTSINAVNPRPGDIKFKNLRDDDDSVNRIDAGDGTLMNPGDRQIIGNNKIRLQYGINLGVNYKGFDLNVLLQGVGKRDVWISDARRWSFASGQFGQIFDDQLDYWKPIDPDNGNWNPVNPDAEYFRIYNQRENSGSNTRAQTKYLLNGAYLRVKNITFSYTFPKTWMDVIHLNALKAFVSCENLHTFSSLPKGYDPERLSWGYPFYRTVSFGINVTL